MFALRFSLGDTEAAVAQYAGARKREVGREESISKLDSDLLQSINILGTKEYGGRRGFLEKGNRRTSLLPLRLQTTLFSFKAGTFVFISD